MLNAYKGPVIIYLQGARQIILNDRKKLNDPSTFV